MKKIIIMILLVAGINLTMLADSYSRDLNVLPKAAQTTIANNFKAKVNLIKIDKTLGIIREYEVILTDGSEITFDNNGNWKDVEVGKGKTVPSGFIHKNISDYVRKNHPKTKIVGIEKDKNNFEIELSDGINIIFSATGSFIKYEK